MSKRAVVWICVFLASLLVYQASADPLPNILILYADDMGYGDLSANNPASKIPTPNLDRLAAEGMRFTDGHSSSGICTPSRYAMLTGRYHWRKFHGIVGSFGKSVFKADRLTLPEMLREKGYHTAHIGKWHLGFGWDAIRNKDVEPKKVTFNGKEKKIYPPEAFDWSQAIPNGPTAHGFDYSFTDAVINFPPYCWIENDRVVEAPDRMMDSKLWKPLKEGRWECRGGPMITGWDPYQNIPATTEKAVSYIHERAESEKPFFLYFALPSPHAPIVPNDKFIGKSQAGPYGDFVYESDDACGQLLKALEEAGAADNTVVIFTADNGAEQYAYERDQKYDHWSSEPFRGVKRYIYEGGHHVPFVVKWPGITQPGSVSDALVSQVDLMGTLAAAIGYELPADQAEDSFDLLLTLRGDDVQVRSSLVHNTFKDAYGLRKGDWVLLNTPEIPRKSGKLNKAWAAKRNYPEEKPKVGMLYNLKTDIGQRQDVSSEHPERVTQMTEQLRLIREQGYSSPRISGASL